MSDNESIRKIIGSKLTTNGTKTYFDTWNPSQQKQAVVTALLELYKAEALGGSAKRSVHENICLLGEDVQHVLAALKGE